MKIIHIVEASATGTLSMLSLLANKQASCGDDVEIVYSLRPESPPDFENMFDKKIIFTKLQMLTYYQKIISIYSLRLHLARSNADIVFMHSSFAGFIGRLSSLRICANCKFFYLPHCISFMRRDIGIIKSFLFIFFEWVACIKPSIYIACSSSEKKEIESKIPFRNCELVVNAVDINEWPNNNLTDQRELRVITVGSIRTQKGPEDFASICKTINKSGHFAEFVWVGDGDEALKIKLREAGVIVTGWKSKNEVSKLLNSSYIYLSTARWEGLPVSIIEAMLSNCLVVATSCQGNIDIVNDSNGYTFKTVDEAVNIINESLKFDKETINLIKESRKQAMQFYSIERYESEIMALVNKYRSSDH